MINQNMNLFNINSKLPKFKYLTPKTVKEAITYLGQYEGSAKAIAGGTDLIVSMKRGNITPQYIIDIKSIPNLNYVSHKNKSLKIGATTTLTELENSLLIRDKWLVLATTAHLIGSPQIRNVATIGGNLCNAAPSADLAPLLIGLGAKVKTKHSKGGRSITLEKFFIGPGQNALQFDEIVTEIEIPNQSPCTWGIYRKLPSKTASGIATIGVAVVVTLCSEGKKISDVRIVLGAVAPTPIRAYQAESLIKGKFFIDKGLIKMAAEAAAEEAKPISDIYASAKYRKKMIILYTQEALNDVLSFWKN